MNVEQVDRLDAIYSKVLLESRVLLLPSFHPRVCFTSEVRSSVLKAWRISRLISRLSRLFVVDYDLVYKKVDF